MEERSRQMKDETIFHLAFEGEAIESGTIEVNDLAPALLALGDLVGEAASEAGCGCSKVSLRVRAGLERGSFRVALEVAQAWYGRAIDLLIGPDATALTNLLELLGIAGAIGLFQLIKTSRGKKPESALEIENTSKVRVTFEGEPPIEVERAVMRLFRSPTARNAAARLVKPLRGKGIDGLKFYHRGTETVAISEADADSFNAPDSQEAETVSETEAILRVEAVSFKEGNKWRLSDGSSTQYFGILDADFLRRMDRGEVRFGKGDCLRVRLRTRQWIEAGDLRISREIVRVDQHLPHPNQIGLPFDQGTSDPSGAPPAE